MLDLYVSWRKVTGRIVISYFPNEYRSYTIMSQNSKIPIINVSVNLVYFLFSFVCRDIPCRIVLYQTDKTIVVRPCSPFYGIQNFLCL